MKQRIIWIKQIWLMLLIGLLCTSFGGCTQAKSPEQQVQKAIKSGSYDEALTIIKENPQPRATPKIIYKIINYHPAFL